MIDIETSRKLALAIYKTEANAILALESSLNEDFFRACEVLARCKGRIALMGLGKSGHIAKKIAATMSSTGSPAFYLHPTEANHGDFGALKPHDIALLLSHSGKTQEILQLLPALERMEVTTIAITAAPDSALGKTVDICIDTNVREEACPLGLAPTTSTTATLATGDALALVVSQAKGFTAADFAKSHPGGHLGRRLILKIKDFMHTGEQIPTVTTETLLSNALHEISNKRLGMTLVVQNPGQVVGIFTDGDLRRALDQGTAIHTTPIHTVMTKQFHTIDQDALAIEGLNLMEQHAITALPVLNKQQRLVGALNIHDLLSAGL